MIEPQTYAELAECFGLKLPDIEGEMKAAHERGASRDELRAIAGLPPIDKKAE